MPGNACERRRWRIQRADLGAAVEKIEEKRQPEDFFGHRKRGLRSNFEPFCPCHRKSLETAGFQGFFFAFFRERCTVCFAALEDVKAGSISHPAAYT